MTMPEPRTDIQNIAFTFPEPYDVGDCLLMVSAFCRKTLVDAGRKAVVVDDLGRARIARSGDNPNGFIPMGYGDIPANRPFWVVHRGPTIGRTA